MLGNAQTGRVDDKMAELLIPNPPTGYGGSGSARDVGVVNDLARADADGMNDARGIRHSNGMLTA